MFVVCLAPLPAAPAREQAVEGYLRTLWERCDQLGIKDPIGETPITLPARLLDGQSDQRGGNAFRVIARKGDPDPSAVRQAYAFIRHDTVGLVVALAPNEERSTMARWEALRQEWDGTELDSPAGMLGEIIVQTALSSSASDAELDKLDAAIRATLPSGGELSPSPYPAQAGLTLWGAPLDAQPRTIVVVARPEDEGVLDGWVWFAGKDMPRLLAYLVNAAKIRYEFGVHRILADRLTRIQEEVDEKLDPLLALHRRMRLGSIVSSDELMEAQLNLGGAQVQSAGLLVTITELREMQRTVSIARFNMKALLPLPRPDWEPSQPSVFDEDDGRAVWLSSQIEHEITYGQAVRERAEAAQGIAVTHLERVAQHRAQRRDQLMLLQTSLLSAVAGALTVVSTFRGTVESALLTPIVAATAAVFLAAPTLIVHWHDGYKRVDQALSGLVGFALGGVLAGILRALHEPASWPVALTAGAALGIVLAVLFFFGVAWVQRGAARRWKHLWNPST